MNVLPGEIIPSSIPPTNHTGMATAIPFEPSKSRLPTTMGRPTTSAAVSTLWTRSAINIQRMLNPSCWYRRARSRSSERTGLRASIDAPHETQRPLAGGGAFFTPQEGQVIDEGVFAAAAIGDRLGKRTP